MLAWIAISFSRWSSWPRHRTQVSCIAGRFFTHLSHQGSPSNLKMPISGLHLVQCCCIWTWGFRDPGSFHLWLCCPLVSEWFQPEQVETQERKRNPSIKKKKKILTWKRHVSWAYVPWRTWNRVTWCKKGSVSLLLDGQLHPRDNPILQKEHGFSGESWPEMQTRIGYICGFKGLRYRHRKDTIQMLHKVCWQLGEKVCLPETSRLYANILPHFLANLYGQSLQILIAFIFLGSHGPWLLA